MRSELFLNIKNFYMVKREKNPITLSSGLQSYLYFDIKSIFGDPWGLNQLTYEFNKMIFDKVKGIDVCIGGMELGGALLAMGLTMRGRDSFFVRKKQKEYGLMKRIEGDITSENVIIVDDVITSGKTVNEVKDIVEQQGYKVIDIMCVIDRTKEGRFTSLFKEKDFL